MFRPAVNTTWAVTGLAEIRLQVTGDGIGGHPPGAVDTNFFEPVGGPPADRPGGYLPPERLADIIVSALTQPPGVDVNTMTVRPIGAPR